MDRRESLKAIVLGSMAAGLTLNGCTSREEIEEKIWKYAYGRTPEEAELDKKLLSEQFFEENELQEIQILANLILPPSNEGTIEEAGVVEFIEFMAKDIPEFQDILRNGLIWLNESSKSDFKKTFVRCTGDQQKTILDRIAFPHPDLEEQPQDIKFFSLVRGLVLTGYFTSEVGIKELDYRGNMPNVWDGVPRDVLDELGMNYDPDWIAKCVDQSKRADLAQWDNDGNLLS